MPDLSLKHIAIVFAASLIAGFFVVLIDGAVLTPIEAKLLTGQTITAA